jgi:hypothetical protein
MYANGIKEKIMGKVDLGDTNRLFIPLLNTNGPMVGDNTLPTTTLYDIGNLGDSLIAYDNPMFLSAGDKYSSMVNDSLCSVQLVSPIAHIQSNRFY